MRGSSSFQKTWKRSIELEDYDTVHQYILLLYLLNSLVNFTASNNSTRRQGNEKFLNLRISCKDGAEIKTLKNQSMRPKLQLSKYF